MLINTNRLRTQDVVVFVNEGGAMCIPEFTFHNCVKAGALTRSDGDPVYEQCLQDCCSLPVARIDELTGDWKITLSGFFPRRIQSTLLRLYEERCITDFRLNFTCGGGRSDIQNFEQSFWLACATVTGYSTSPLGANAPTEKGLVTEEVTIAFPSLSKILHATYTLFTDFAGQVRDVVFCEPETCDICIDLCNHIYVVVLGDDGFVNLWVSENNGRTWIERQVVDDAGVTDAWLACIGGTLHIITSGQDTNIYTIPLAFAADNGAVIQHVLFNDPFENGNDVSVNSKHIYIAADDGVLRVLGQAPYTDVQTGFGFAMQAVSATDKAICVAGDGGNIFETTNDGDTWLPVDTPFTDVITAIDKTCNGCTFVGTDIGELYVLNNSEWQLIQQFDATIFDIAFDCLCHNGYLTVGERLYRSYDGGQSWVNQPNDDSAFPVTGVNLGDLAVCQCDGNRVIAVAGNAIVNGGTI